MIDYGRVTGKNQYSYIVSFIESNTVTIQDQTLPIMGIVGLIACSDQDARKKVIGKLSPLEVEITNVRRISDDATIHQIILPYRLHYYVYGCSGIVIGSGDCLGVSPINAVNRFLEEILNLHDFIVFTSIEANVELYSKYNVKYTYDQGAGLAYTSTTVVDAYSPEHAKLLMTTHIQKVLKCRVVGDMDASKCRIGTKDSEYKFNYVCFDDIGRLTKNIVIKAKTYEDAFVEFYAATGLPKSYVNHVSLVIYDREDSGLKKPEPKSLTNRYVVKYVVGCSSSVVIAEVTEKVIVATSEQEVLNHLANTGHPDYPITVLSIMVENRA